MAELTYPFSSVQFNTALRSIRTVRKATFTWQSKHTIKINSKKKKNKKGKRDTKEKKSQLKFTQRPAVFYYAGFSLI